MLANSVVALILVIQVTLVTPVIPATPVRFCGRLQNLKSEFQNLNLDFPLECNPSLTCHSCHPTMMDKSLGTLLHFWGVFQFTQVQLLPSPHKKSWMGKFFSELQLCIGWGGGGGGTTRKFQKGCPVLLGNPDKKYDYCITLPRTFVHDCSYPSNPSHLSHHSPLYFPLTSHPNHPRYPYYFSRCSYPTHAS